MTQLNNAANHKHQEEEETTPNRNHISKHSSLFPNRGNWSATAYVKHLLQITQNETYTKLTALERPVTIYWAV